MQLTSILKETVDSCQMIPQVAVSSNVRLSLSTVGVVESDQETIWSLQTCWGPHRFASFLICELSQEYFLPEP